MKGSVRIPIVASGGVTTSDDVHRLRAAGLDGCIIGRALYKGIIRLQDCKNSAIGTTFSSTKHSTETNNKPLIPFMLPLWNSPMSRQNKKTIHLHFTIE